MTRKTAWRISLYNRPYYATSALINMVNVGGGVITKCMHFQLKNNRLLFSLTKFKETKTIFMKTIF